MPVLAAVPLFILVSLILPVIVITRVTKQSVVERLRENEG